LHAVKYSRALGNDEPGKQNFYSVRRGLNCREKVQRETLLHGTTATLKAGEIIVGWDVAVITSRCGKRDQHLVTASGFPILKQ